MALFVGFNGFIDRGLGYKRVVMGCMKMYLTSTLVFVEVKKNHLCNEDIEIYNFYFVNTF